MLLHIRQLLQNMGWLLLMHLLHLFRSPKLTLHIVNVRGLYLASQDTQ